VGTRVSLDSVVYAWLRGESPLGIVESFPSLSLNQVNGAIAYYEAHRRAIDAHLKQEEIEFEKMRQEARAKDPAFYAKMEAAKHASSGRRR
jgi:uncharacterized protein DUF433